MNEKPEPEDFRGPKRCETPFCPEVQAQVRLWRTMLQVQKNTRRGSEIVERPQRPLTCSHQTSCRVQSPPDWDHCAFREAPL